MKTALKALVGVAGIALSACSPETSSAPESTPATAKDVAQLYQPEPAAKVEEYEARVTRLRLFGTQPGDAPFATLADTRTWQTKNYGVGALVGRNWKVTAVDAKGLELTSGAGVVQRLAPGQDLEVREIRHKFDVAAEYRGRSAWRVNAASLADLEERRGTGAEAIQRDLFAERSVQLTRVDPEGLFGRLGFREGDLVFSVDGRPIDPEALASLGRRMTQPREAPMRVKLMREGSVHELAFDVH